MSPHAMTIMTKLMGTIFETDPKIWSAAAEVNVSAPEECSKTWHNFLERSVLFETLRKSHGSADFIVIWLCRSAVVCDVLVTYFLLCDAYMHSTSLLSQRVWMCVTRRYCV